MECSSVCSQCSLLLALSAVCGMSQGADVSPSPQTAASLSCHRYIFQRYENDVCIRIWQSCICTKHEKYPKSCFSNWDISDWFWHLGLLLMHPWMCPKAQTQPWGHPRSREGINQFQSWTLDIEAQQAAAHWSDIDMMGDRQQTPCDYDGLTSEIKQRSREIIASLYLTAREHVMVKAHYLTWR